MANVRAFGAAGDGQHDDSDAIDHALADGDGLLEFPPGVYRLTRTIVVQTSRRGPCAISGAFGTARLVMEGPGPALSLLGSHTGSADPADFRPEQWQRERMPTLANLEIVGAHPQADGVRIEGVMQPTLTGLLVRRARTAIHLVGRARNLLISHCHLYHNTGVGVHLDHVNLHQAIIASSHISYCRLAGIRVECSEIRNLQITGNDIEYNNHRAHQGLPIEERPAADIDIDCRKGTVREGTIVSNTIQATMSPGGANVRFHGQGPDKPHKTGLWTITGNLIGSQETNLHLTMARGVTVTGNVFYSGHAQNLLLEDSRNIVFCGNLFDHNPDYEPNELCTGIRLVGSRDCALGSFVIQDCQAGRHTVPEAAARERLGLIELVRCRRVNLSGVQVLDSAPYGIYLRDCADTLIQGCTILDGRPTTRLQSAILWEGEGSGNLVANCRLQGEPARAVVAPAHVRQWNNLAG
jgi:hypothetical protein